MVSDSHVDIALCGRCIYAKITGLAHMNNCMTFQDFSTLLLESGYERVIVDLSQCTGMDSTFLGVLAGMATHMENRQQPTVVIINASRENLETIESVGLNHFVEIHSGDVAVPNLETYRIDDEVVSDRDRVQFIKASHEKLIAIDKRNQEKFGPLLKLLEQEMSQRK